MITTVSVSEMAISDHQDDQLVIPKLGSCLGISAYDPINKIGGVIHCLLPTFIKTHLPIKNYNPCLFVENGLEHFLSQLEKEGANLSNLIISVAGGAKLLGEKDIFNLGDRNLTSFRKILWRYKLLIDKQDTGGNQVRQLILMMNNGNVITKREN